MSRIWKFPLALTDVQTLKMPQGARILAVQTQDNTPCMWAVVDPEEDTEPRTFLTYGTGNPMPNHELSDTHRGTYQLNDGALVFHVFEVTKRT